MTYTYAILTVSSRTFEEIRAKLQDAGYDHAFHEDGLLVDMNGIVIQAEAAPSGTTAPSGGPGS